jgi:hypothetical protein
MSARKGMTIAKLIQPEEVSSPELVDLINTNINPPEALSADDVYIRAMYVVSDQVNSFGGKFPIEELQSLANLIVDSPVMIGHRKDRLPIGRNFFAKVEQKESFHWVKSYFYWLKSADNAEDLRRNIDGGIYKECSLGFTFHLAECSICGKDIRLCDHEPFQSYGKNEICHFNYRKVERVLEASLVYRGAQPDTSITSELYAGNKSHDKKKPGKPESLKDLAYLDPDNSYLVTPYYDGIPLLVNHQEGTTTIVRLDDGMLGDKLLSCFTEINWPELKDRFALLVGYRGKERLLVVQLEQYLKEQPSPVTRVEIKLFPSESYEPDAVKLSSGPHRICQIRYHVCKQNELVETVNRLATRQGVRIWASRNSLIDSPGYRYNPSQELLKVDTRYSIVIEGCSSHAVLIMKQGERLNCFRIRQFNIPRLLKGSRFIADRVENITEIENNSIITQGEITDLANQDDALLFTLEGNMAGSFVLRPIRMDGTRRFLLYRLSDPTGPAGSKYQSNSMSGLGNHRSD